MSNPDPFRRLDALRERLLERVLYANAAWEARCREVFRPTIAQMPFVQDIAAHVLRLDGKTAADHVRHFSTSDRALLDAHSRAWCSIFQIEAITADRFTLTDLLTHRRLDVRVRISTCDDVGDCVLGRVVTVDDDRLLVRPHPFTLPLERAVRVLERLRRRFGDAPVPTVTLRPEPATIAIIRRWEDELHADAPRPATHERFTFLEEDRPHIEAALTHLPGSTGPTLEPHDHHRYTIVPAGSLVVGPHTIELTAPTPQLAHLLASMVLATAPELRRQT